MIAADTSTWIAFLEGDHGDDVELLDTALRDQQVLMAPLVLTELLSDPKRLLYEPRCCRSAVKPASAMP